jgi:hypothetical protein
MLTVDQTVRSYAGARGCMCGCKGKYNTSERARKRAITDLLKDPAVRLDSWAAHEFSAGCLFVDTPTRTRALYLTEAGVAAVRALGVKED